MPPKGERRKQQVIQTAKDMFMENGFQSTHIGQICEKLDIARGTVYQYFSNKKEILYAILSTLEEEVEDILDPDDIKEYYNSGMDQKSFDRLIMDRISASISVIVNEPILIKLIFKEIAGIDQEVIDMVNKTVARIINIISKEVEINKANGVFKPSLNSNISASMLVGGISLLVYEYDLNKKDVLDKAVIESIANNYLKGVLK